MVGPLLTFARKQLWKFRRMLYWRTVVLGLYVVYIVFWVHAPLLLGMYLAKTQLPFLAVLSIPLLITNGKFLYREGETPFPSGDRILEERNDLRYLIPRAKDAVDLLKESLKRELSGYETDILTDYLYSIGADKGETDVLMMYLRGEILIDFRDM